MADYEKLGLFYLGRTYDLESRKRTDALVLYDSRDLVTHAVCVGMTGSGKTGLCLALLEEAAVDGIPALVIDPKGDLGNLLLTFPELTAEAFRPWINEDDARRERMEPDAFAAAEAAKWRNGLAEWSQGAARIRTLRESADMVIYTPGSQSGIPISVLHSFAAPPSALVDDADLMRERVSTTASSLLGLVGIDADPIKSREHILLSTLFDAAWRQGQALDLAALIQQVQTPPVTHVGVLELEAFFPSKDRFALAMALNHLLAAPGFRAWTEGEPLDVQRLLFTPEGKPRVAVLSIAHLNDAERMFFVSLLLNQVLGWTRTQAGTTSLRALVYIDEIAGYLPPTANPPSKLALLTLMKQARAFGVGVVVATQNPVDLDYKALSNAGTWFIGRLQTERDQMRVLDGLEGALERAGRFDRQAMGRALSALPNRVFVMHNVHDDGPTILESRWALSYLRGPLTRTQIKTLMDPLRAAFSGPPAPASSRPRQAARSPATQAIAAGADELPTFSARWVLPPDIAQYFAPASGPAVLSPMLTGVATVRFVSRPEGVDEMRMVTVVTPITSAAVPVDWSIATEAPFTTDDLARESPPGATFKELPAAAQRTKNYAGWTKTFVAWLTRQQSLQLFRSATYDLVSRPGEREGDFRARIAHAAREARDREVARIRQKYAPKLVALQERRRRAEQNVQKQQEQASESTVQTAISFGTTLLGAVLGRKTFGAGTLGRATTAARGVGRSVKESSDVDRARETVSAIDVQMQELETSLQADIAGIDASHAPTEALETLTLTPKRTGIQVELVALTWLPER
jgi:hypothetical protein